MSEPVITLLNYPFIRGGIYLYKKTGDVLPWHTHAPEDAHISIVCVGVIQADIGRVDATGNKIIDKTIDLVPGQCLDTPPGAYHEFTAKTDGAKAYHLVKGVNFGTNPKG